MDKRPKGRLPRLTDGFHLQDIGNAAKSAASLDKLRKFLESQKLIKCSHKAWVPAHKASVPRAQSSSLCGTKLGLGRAQSRFPRVLHLGGDIVLHELTRSRSYIVGWWVPTGTHWYPGVYCGYLWDDGAQLGGIVAFPNWSHAVMPCPIYIDTVH